MFLTLWDMKLRVIRILLIVITIFYSCLIMYSVILRYGFSDTIIGIEELATYSAIWAYFLGAAYGSYERSHISASLIPVVFQNPRTKDIMEAVANFIGILISGIMTWHVYRYFSWSLQTRPRSLELETDLVWFHGAVFFGFIMMTLYMIFELADRIQILRNKRPLPISPLRETERTK